MNKLNKRLPNNEKIIEIIFNGTSFKQHYKPQLKTNATILFRQNKIQKQKFIKKIITNKRNKQLMIKENNKENKKESFLNLKLK